MAPHDHPPSDSPNTRHDDWWAMGELFSHAVDQIVSPIEGIHHAIADRWFRLAGPAAEPVRRGYQGLTKAVYSSLRITASAIGSVVPLVTSRQTDKRAPGLRHGLTSIANALWGDDLERRGSRLALPMAFRDGDGQPIRLTHSAVSRAFPGAGSDIVLLVHGLGENERCWRRDTEPEGLAQNLAAIGLTPVLVRYNTGLHISTNGEELAALIDKLAEVWPVAVESIALVGNSMGGLVVRSALDTAMGAGFEWPRMTWHLITIGAPHLGSPLEKGANYLAWGLSRTPESRPLGDFLRRRSAGIKDLRFGATRRQDWADVDPDALLGDTVRQLVPPDGVEQHFVAGVVTESATHPVGTVIGDLVVRVGSALGLGRQRRVDATDVFVVGGQRHYALATDPTVHEQIRRWLANSNP